MGHIEVLVVDDSLLMQRVLTDVLQSDKPIVVVGTARNGEGALQKISNLRPDAVTMDIEMPKMDGLTAVRKIMDDMTGKVSNLTKGVERGFEALSLVIKSIEEVASIAEESSSVSE